MKLCLSAFVRLSILVAVSAKLIVYPELLATSQVQDGLRTLAVVGEVRLPRPTDT